MCVRESAAPGACASRAYPALLKALTRDFPRRPVGSLRAATFGRHVTYIQPLTRVHIGHESVLTRVNAYVSAATPSGPPRQPLVLTGLVGGGKSTALANWLVNTRTTGVVHPSFGGSD